MKLIEKNIILLSIFSSNNLSEILYFHLLTAWKLLLGSYFYLRKSGEISLKICSKSKRMRFQCRTGATVTLYEKINWKLGFFLKKLYIDSVNYNILTSLSLTFYATLLTLSYLTWVTKTTCASTYGLNSAGRQIEDWYDDICNVIIFILFIVVTIWWGSVPR